jgi:hypothetical protein
MDEKRAHSRKLMHEAAAITIAAGARSVPVILLDISLHSISFASAEEMHTGDIHSLRFTLPGSGQLHFVTVKLVARSASHMPSGFRYGATFARINNPTIDDIVLFLSRPV